MSGSEGISGGKWVCAFARITPSVLRLRPQKPRIRTLGQEAGGYLFL